MTARLRSSLPAWLLATALVGSGATAVLAADDGSADGSAAETSLCDLVSIDELRSLTGLTFEAALELPFACTFASTIEGFDTIGMVALQETLDALRQPDSIELTAGTVFGLAHTIDGDVEVVLDLGEEGVLVIRATAGAVEGSGRDAVDLGMAVAEIAVGNLEASTLSGPGEGGVSSPLAPPAVDGVDLSFIRLDGDVETVRSGQPQIADMLVGMADELGAAADSLSFYQADSGGQSTDPGYQAYLAARVPGADAEPLRQAFVEAFGLADFPPESGIETADAEVSGKPVRVFTAPALSDSSIYLYVSGDTVHLLQMAEPEAARLLAALP